MLNVAKYLIPAGFALLFVGLHQWPYADLLFIAVLLVANLLGNWLGGEFTNDEIGREIRFFDESPSARSIKLLSALVLLAVFGWCLWYVDQTLLVSWRLIGFSLLVGFLTGCFMVTLAHELLHGHSRLERSTANVLLVVAGIPHFANDHVLGHHRLVGLAEDETTAKYGMSFYRYVRKAAVQRWRESYVTGYLNLPPALSRSVRRQNTWLALGVAGLYVVIGLLSQHPAATLLFVLVQSLAAYGLYELINYIQHYGLQRQLRPGGKPEPVRVEHAWNCYYKYTNYFLFMLPLHSAHHACPHPRTGQNLMGPRMPFVYFVMVGLALIPSLWFRLMNPLVRRERRVRARAVLVGCWLCVWLGLSTASGQGNVGLRYVFGTWHPVGNNMAFLMPHRLDPKAYLVLNWGLIGSYQYYFHKQRWSIKVAQGAYSDCAQLFAGHTHLGFRLNPLNSDRHFLEIGFGPTFVYRQTWYRFPGYEQQTGLLKNTDRWQWNFVWYGGEVEYDYRVSRHLDLTLNAIPGPPDFVTFGIGARYWPHDRPNRLRRKFRTDN